MLRIVLMCLVPGSGSSVVMAQGPSDEASIIVRVFQAADRSPITGAHVFIFNSMLAATTDNEGIAALRLPAVASQELVVYKTGFSAVSRLMQPQEGREYEIAVYLSPSGDTLVPEHAILRHKYALTELLGKSIRGNRARLRNPESLHTKETMHGYMAWATDILEIENTRLGYTIFCVLESLERTQRMKKMKARWYFVPMTARDEAEMSLWKNRCRDVHEGSLNHFLRALAEDQLVEQSFDTYLVGYVGAPLLRLKPSTQFSAPRDQLVGQPDSLNAFDVGKDGWALRALYVGVNKKVESYIFFQSTPIRMYPDGRVANHESLVLGGQWESDGLADLVPWTFSSNGHP